MPRTPHRDLPDGHFHVMTHAIEGGRLFHRDADRKMYLGLLQLTIERNRWRLLAFVLMGNHVHLLVECKTRDLSAGLWWMHWRYAEHYKRSYCPRFGHVFGGRPKPKPIRDDAYFLAVVRYIARNPVGVMCDRPEDYRWSSHRVMLGQSAALPMLGRAGVLGWFGPVDAVGQYAEFVNGSDPDDHRLVRQWASGPPEDRPDLETLVADSQPESFLIAHEMWEYSIRAIAQVSGRSEAAVRKVIHRSRPA